MEKLKDTAKLKVLTITRYTSRIRHVSETAEKIEFGIRELERTRSWEELTEVGKFLFKLLSFAEVIKFRRSWKVSQKLKSFVAVGKFRCS